MKKSTKPMSSTSASATFIIVFFALFVLLLSLTGCGAGQTGITAAAPATGNTTKTSTAASGSQQSSGTLEATEAMSTEETLTCYEFKERLTERYVSNYWAGGWTGAQVSLGHEDHEHTIALDHEQTVLVDGKIYGDINMTTGGYMSLCIKQGHETSYFLDLYGSPIQAFSANHLVAEYENPEHYDLYMSLQSPAEDAKYLIAKEDWYTAVSTLVVLNLETKEWQILSDTWANGEYWFSETGKTLFFQNIDGQAYKFDLMLTKTEPVPVNERYDGLYWTAKLIVSDDGVGTLNYAPAGYSLVRDTGFSAQETYFIANAVLLGSEAKSGCLFISRDGGNMCIMNAEESFTVHNHPWRGERGVHIMDICEDFYDGDDKSIPAHQIRLLVESWVKGSGAYSLDVITVATDWNGYPGYTYADKKNIASGKYGVACFNGEGRYAVGLHVIVDGEHFMLEDYETALMADVYDLVPFAQLEENPAA